MAIDNIRQAQIAYKNLLGKAQVQKNFSVTGESTGFDLKVSSDNVWSSPIAFNDPSTTVNNQYAVQVLADLEVITDSAFGGKFLSYQAVWGATPSTFGAKDPKTNQLFEYGKGSLKDIVSGDNVLDFIPDSNGLKYKVGVYTSYPSDQVAEGDTRDWLFQYNSGVLYQDNVLYAGYVEPTKVLGYYYIGNKLSALDPTGPAIVRVSATGPDVTGAYYATDSNPFISTYSINSLYLVDFALSNTQSVKLNIDYLGTLSVYKYGLTGLGELSSGDIQGATGSTAGPSYYLTYNPDGYFQFFESNPSQTPGSYTQESPVNNKVGGIERGYSFYQVKLQDMFTDLLYPETLTNYTSISVTNSLIAPSSTEGSYFIDMGRIFTGTLTFSWTGTNPSNLSNGGISYILDLTPVSTPTSNWPGPDVSSPFYFTDYQGTFATTYSIYSNVPDKRTFGVFSNRTNGTKISKLAQIEWTWRAYYGSSTYTVLSPNQVVSLDSKLATQSIGTWSITGSSGYKYFAVPDLDGYRFSNISYYNFPVVLATNSYTLVDNGNNYTTLTVTNSYSRSTTYRLYRTLNQINGTLNVNITK